MEVSQVVVELVEVAATMAALVDIIMLELVVVYQELELNIVQVHMDNQVHKQLVVLVVISAVHLDLEDRVLQTILLVQEEAAVGTEDQLLEMVQVVADQDIFLVNYQMLLL